MEGDGAMVANRSAGSGQAERVVSFIPEPPPVTGDPETLRSWSHRQFRTLSLEMDKVQRALGDAQSQNAALVLIVADLAARLAVVEADEWDR